MGSAVIAGAGPAGAVLAYLLAERGVEVTLLERHHDFGREFRGEDMPPPGVDVFAQMGLGDELASLPNREITATDVYRNGRKRFAIRWGGDTGTYGSSRFIPQPPLLEMVTQRAARFATFDLIRGAVVRGPIVEAGRVIGVEAEVEGEHRRLSADLVIGCDGRTSVLRRKSGLDEHREESEEAFDVVWTRTPFTDPSAFDGKARLYLARGRIMLVLPTPDGHLQLGTIIEKGTFGDLRKLGTDGWIEHLAQFVSDDLVGQLRSHAPELKLALLDVVCFNLRAWTAPGLLLLGDAAHPMSPAGGQGLTQALRDAVAASNRLAPVLSATDVDPDSVDLGARTVQRDREVEVRAIQAHQARVPPVLFQRTWYSNVVFAGIAPLVARIRPALLTKAVDAASAPFLRGLGDLRLDPPAPVT